MSSREEDERPVRWPKPRKDPEREPSHPGARDDEDEGWWQRWLEEDDRGSDA